MLSMETTNSLALDRRTCSSIQYTSPDILWKYGHWS